MPAAVIVAGGPGVITAPAPGPGSVVIAADSGADRATGAGWPVHHVVGDLDSVTESTVDRLHRAGVQIHRHPVGKDETDLELALALACSLGADPVDVVFGSGGRFDHVLVSVLVLADERWAGRVVGGWMDDTRLDVVRDHLDLVDGLGATVTLVPVGGPATIRTEGLAFPLAGEQLAPTSGRGVSNRVVAPTARVDVTAGVVLVVRPS